MGTTNKQWYNLNSSRLYPVDESASGLSDSGELLKNSVIADVSIRFPRSAGRYVFLSDACVTSKGLVTAAFSAAEDSPTDIYSSGSGYAPVRRSILGNMPAPTGAGSAANRRMALYNYAREVSEASEDSESPEIPAVPILAVSILNPIVGKCYMLESQYPGAGGCIVFGEGVKDSPMKFRASSSSQSMICPKAATYSQSLPVSGVAKPLGVALTGLINLKGGNDIEIVKECREIPAGVPYEGCDDLNTQSRDVIVVRLKSSLNSSASNVFERYAGPCGGRPETRTCGNPEPVELLSGITPDCCGRITVEFKGCAVPGQITDGGSGIILDCNLGISEVCLNPTHLPSADGTLPNSYVGGCEDAVSEISL